MLIQSRPRLGFSSLLVLLILAILSSTLIAVSVNMSHQHTQSIQTQRDKIIVETQITKQLFEAIVDYSASGQIEHVNESIALWQLNTTSDSTVVVNKNKQYQLITLTASANSDISKLTQSVNLLATKRLETAPMNGLTRWSYEDTNQLIARYFKTEPGAFYHYIDAADTVLHNCIDETYELTGFIWIDSGCTLTELEIGNPKQPVLVVNQGSLTLSEVTIYGVIVQLCAADSHLTISNELSSKIVGALVTNCPESNISFNSDTRAIQYDIATIQTLIEHWDNLDIQTVKGTWLNQ